MFSTLMAVVFFRQLIVVAVALVFPRGKGLEEQIILIEKAKLCTWLVML